MLKLIKELRRREVFRTAGLYVGVAWIIVEVSSVLFDAFEAPEWALQAVIILAVIGLPVTIVLAWIFDITEHGIEVQAEATDTMVIPFGGRRMDFVVIGVLSVALIFSVTTYDSASYILASVATRRLEAGEDPDRWHRVFWAGALAVLPLTLMFIGGLKVIQSATLVVSLPLTAVGVLMSISLVRQLREDHGQDRL